VKFVFGGSPEAYGKINGLKFGYEQRNFYHSTYRYRYGESQKVESSGRVWIVKKLIPSSHYEYKPLSDLIVYYTDATGESNSYTLDMNLTSLQRPAITKPLTDKWPKIIEKKQTKLVLSIADDFNLKPEDELTICDGYNVGEAIVKTLDDGCVEFSRLCPGTNRGFYLKFEYTRSFAENSNAWDTTTGEAFDAPIYVKTNDISIKYKARAGQTKVWLEEFVLSGLDDSWGSADKLYWNLGNNERWDFDEAGYASSSQRGMSNTPVVKLYLKPEWENGWWYQFGEIQLKPMLTNPIVTPTTIEIDYIQEESDTEILRINWETKTKADDSFSTVENVNGIISDLQPSSDYSLHCKVTYKTEEYRPQTATFNYELKLPQLEIKTLAPRAMNENSVRVTAETNLSSTVDNAGFQWRKYEAPETLASSEAFAPIYEGELQGVLKNLSQTSFYNARAFYRGQNGKEYFGDWVTFDPSEFSYFEPTAHTYSAMNVDDSSALLRGVVIEGSDDIEEQCFEYWYAEDSKSVKTSCRSANDVITIISSGQVMEILVQDLDPETTYVYRSYVIASGKKYYGETKNFTTMAGSLADVCEIEQDNTVERRLLGRYSLFGYPVNENYYGIVIEVYSDGSQRKMFQNR